MESADLSFGSFRLCVGRRVLLEEGKQVKLGARAFDVLRVLAERSGALVTNEELVRSAWGDTNVDDRALRVHLSALRKALGEARTKERFIANIPGQGYSFVAPVTPVTGALAPPSLRLTPTVGRDEFVASTVATLRRSRFVSIVGPGGVGKTTVAITIAETVGAAYPEGVFVAELASLQNAALLPSRLASLFGLGSYSEDPLPGLIAYLRPRATLLVLDNCEHVALAAATIVERILVGAPNVHVLTTSREPLRATGEWVRRLAPLEIASAVTLFVERARASAADFELNDDNRDLVLDLCERLDRLPLAIELAAARIPEIGIRSLARGAGDRFAVLNRGRRTALPRHKTLRGLLDWSYALLDDSEKRALRSVSVFAGDFGVEEAAWVGAAESLADLVAKSLVSVDVTGDHERYRLLETTRHYGRERLAAEGETAAMARKHAETCLAVAMRSIMAWSELSSKEWSAAFGHWIDDVRGALEWAFSTSGDESVGVMLTLNTWQLWTQLALMDEYRGYVERALLARPLDGGLEARLSGVLGNILFHTLGPLADTRTSAAFERSLAAARLVGDRQSELFACSGLCAVAVTHGDYPAGVAFAERFDETIGLAGRVAKDRALAHVVHYLGDFERSQRHIDIASSDFEAARRMRSSGVAYDHEVTILSVQARLHWLMGRPDLAIETSRACVQYAQSIDHAVSLCLALVMSSCVLEFLVGGRRAADPYLALLRDTSVKHSMLRSLRYFDIYDLAMMPRAQHRAAEMSALALSHIDGPQLDNCAILGDELTDPRIVARAMAGKGEWCRAELLRVRGQALLEGDVTKATRRRAEAWFDESLALARRQGTKAWELRTATSFASSLRDTGRLADARALLGPVLASFTEGRSSIDVKRAADVMASLA